MKPNSGCVTRAIAGAAIFVIVAGLFNAADGATPTIEMENVPLSEAIRNVTRQMELNYIIDPRLLTPGGVLRSNPPITVSWQNITLREALERLLKEHGAHEAFRGVEFD